MCGIVGVSRFDGSRAKRSQLQEMKASVAHRGPDEKGTFLDGAVGLGHQRLSIIDRAHGRQPLVAVAGQRIAAER